jgi:hypothetical protein
MKNTIVPTITTRIVSRRPNDRCSAKTTLRTRVPHPDRYPTKVIQLELARVKKAWSKYQSTRDRDGIYVYLKAVFDLVSKWREQGDDAPRAICLALGWANCKPRVPSEPFAAVIFCTSDPEKVDDRTRSKWSRALRYAAGSKKETEPLMTFIKRVGGINECASRFADRDSPSN